MALRQLIAKIHKNLCEHPVFLEDALNGLIVPALILWGQEDRITNVAGAAILEPIMPNANAVAMKNTGHIPLMENPRLTAEYFLEL